MRTFDREYKKLNRNAHNALKRNFLWNILLWIKTFTVKPSTPPWTNLKKKNILTKQYYGRNFTCLIGKNIRRATKKFPRQEKFVGIGALL